MLPLDKFRQINRKFLHKIIHFFSWNPSIGGNLKQKEPYKVVIILKRKERKIVNLLSLSKANTPISLDYLELINDLFWVDEPNIGLFVTIFPEKKVIIQKNSPSYGG